MGSILRGEVDAVQGDGGGDTGGRLALGYLVAGIARLLETAVAYLDRPQPQRRDPVGEEMAAEPGLSAAERAGRHMVRKPFRRWGAVNKTAMRALCYSAKVAGTFVRSDGRHAP
jgi:hypothetical protein